jgi:hypothetical protein
MLPGISMSNAGALGASAGGGGPTPPGPPPFADVKLLCGFEGTNGSTTITDESSSLHGTATVNNSAQISTSQAKFGSSSLLLTASSSDDISWPDDADWNFGSGQFTVECFIRPVTLSGFKFLVGQWFTSGDLGWILYLNGTSLSFNYSTTSSDNNTMFTAGTLTTGAWHHIAIDYDGSKYRLYLDGTCIATHATPHTFNDSTDVLAIGSNATDGSFFYDGYMDEIRITKGYACYASDTSYTVPTAAFPRS